MQVHRFRDRVAIHLATGPTHYLLPSEAKAIGKLLMDCAKDVRAASYGESQFESCNVYFEPGLDYSQGMDTPGLHRINEPAIKRKVGA